MERYHSDDWISLSIGVEGFADSILSRFLEDGHALIIFLCILRCGFDGQFEFN